MCAHVMTPPTKTRAKLTSTSSAPITTITTRPAGTGRRGGRASGSGEPGHAGGPVGGGASGGVVSLTDQRLRPSQNHSQDPRQPCGREPRNDRRRPRGNKFGRLPPAESSSDASRRVIPRPLKSLRLRLCARSPATRCHSDATRALARGPADYPTGGADLDVDDDFAVAPESSGWCCAPRGSVAPAT